MTSKTIKLISSLFLLAGFAGFLAVGYYAKQENLEVTAQEFGPIECNGPIVPNGEIPDDVIKLVNVVFKQYQLSAGYLNSVIGYTQALLASLSQTESVCDFALCTPEMANNMPGEVSNVAPGFSLTLNAYVVKGELGIRPGICTPGEGEGDPCALGDIRANVKGLDTYKSAFSGAYQNINDTFSLKETPVTEDTRIKANDYRGRPEENADSALGPVALLTRQEEIRRKIETAEALIELCSLTALERKMFEQGKMGKRKLEKCIDALRDKTYKHPKPWSEACEIECSAGASQECVNCLGRCEGTSVLAKLNCRIYSRAAGPDFPKNCSNGADDSCCGNVCREGYDTPECDECLSRGLTKEQSQAWLCGGHLHNWLCCSAVALGSKEL